MKLLINLALRNLFRQKRRNILLGIAIALGVTILVISNSFSQGISDIMFNKIMRWVTGQITVRFNEKGKIYRELFRDKDRAMALIKSEPGVLEADEAIGMFCRAIGNGKSDNVILVGVNTSGDISEESRKEVEESFRLIEGKWEDLNSASIENPTIVSSEKAKYLNVKMGDVIRLRFRNMFGQDQAVRLTIRGIMKNDNIFMQPVIFLEQKKAKEVLGYRPYETGSIALKIKDPQKNAKDMADRIHDKLKPGLAVIYASVTKKAMAADAAIFGYNSSTGTKKELSGMLRLTSGEMDAAMKKDGVLVSAPLAKQLGISPGDAVFARYARKFEAVDAELKYIVSAVFAPSEGLPENSILVNDDRFYDDYNQFLPKQVFSNSIKAPKEGERWHKLLSTEWVLLNRTYTTDDYVKKYREIGQQKWKGTSVDVSTMYETASDILKLEGVLKLITLSAVLVLFFIILLGVVNTLRMTIRERTREIGTIRAIGMQKKDVRNTFILETFFLSLFSSIAGVIAAFGAMHLLSLITFTMSDNPFGMLLVNGHLYFLPTFSGIAGNVLLILIIAVVTAYFPARRAANLSPAKALGHFE